jgi:mevalonate pyrophosphate decarboxylase
VGRDGTPSGQACTADSGQTLLDSNTQTGVRVVGDSDEVNSFRNDRTYYRIDAGSMVYVVARSLRNPRDKALDVTINRAVQFAIDGAYCYLKDDEGKEHKLTVEQNIAK